MSVYGSRGATTFLKLGGTNPWRALPSAVALACIGGLGAVPPVGSKSEAPCQGAWGKAPLKLTTFLHLNVNLNIKNCTIFCICMQSIMLKRMQTAGTLFTNTRCLLQLRLQHFMWLIVGLAHSTEDLSFPPQF